MQKLLHLLFNPACLAQVHKLKVVSVAIPTRLKMSWAGSNLHGRRRSKGCSPSLTLSSSRHPLLVTKPLGHLATTYDLTIAMSFAGPAERAESEVSK